ncbi:ephrin-B2-like isoform X1 [Branchiostoma floridae]|uniref:Ephrin-B2-like isoform X1 n=1 Tax=Branchiostoma floridae TaxID=7739 RepID=A0A9J7KRI4_BRAFL|nr:ephrin-B2-like isoform X1 [Branchiostoma floridae]
MRAAEAWVLYGTLLLRLASAIGVILPDVYWNMSNNIFSGGGYHLSPNVNDMVTVFCPHYEVGSTDLVEYNVLYEVDEDGYNRCDAERGRPLLRCDRPYRSYPLSLTIYFQEFSPSPYGLEFDRGRDYYYISTSTGEYGGLNATVGGNCVNGMKMKLSICCKSNTSDTSVANTLHLGVSWFCGLSVAALFFNMASLSPPSLSATETPNVVEEQTQRRSPPHIPSNRIPDADWSESSDTNNEISKETAFPRPDYDFSRTSSAPSWLTGRAASLTASIFTVALAWALTRL